MDDFIRYSEILKNNKALFLLVGLAMLGVTMRRTHRLDNNWIPVTLTILGAVLYPFLGKADPNATYPIVDLSFWGAFLGGLAIGLISLLKSIKPFRPFFDPKFTQNGDTEYYTKDQLGVINEKDAKDPLERKPNDTKPNP